jgi:uncharacterized membrane protein
MQNAARVSPFSTRISHDDSHVLTEQCFSQVPWHGACFDYSEKSDATGNCERMEAAMQKMLAMSSKANVGSGERWVSIIAGVLLLRSSLPSKKALRAAVGGGLLYRGVVGTCPVYSAAAIDTTQQGRLVHKGLLDNRSSHFYFEKKIDRPVKEVFRFCRSFDNLRRFRCYIGAFHKTADNHAYWSMEGPAHLQLTSNFAVTEAREDERLSWRSLPGTQIHNSGTLRFFKTEGGKQTTVRLVMDITPPGGVFGALLFQGFRPFIVKRVKSALQELKGALEAKELQKT